MPKSILRRGLAMVLLTMGMANPLAFNQNSHDEKPAIIPRMMNITSAEFAAMGGAYMDAPPGDDNHPVGVEKRQAAEPCTAPTVYFYKLKGDGNPHQNFIITQKAGTLTTCSTSGGTTNIGHSHSVSWSISGGLNTPWSSISAGVSESETYSQGQGFTCQGVADSRGAICALYYQAVTAFTVDIYSRSKCDAKRPRYESTEIVYAPNKDRVGGTVARGISVSQHGVVQCFGDVDRTVNYHCGPRGDASWWRGRNPGPWSDEYVNAREPADCKIPIEAYLFND